jgi:excisionase family DNA binding protein
MNLEHGKFSARLSPISSTAMAGDGSGRALATRYDKLAVRYLATMWIAALAERLHRPAHLRDPLVLGDLRRRCRGGHSVNGGGSHDRPSPIVLPTSFRRHSCTIGNSFDSCDRVVTCDDQGVYRLCMSSEDEPLLTSGQVAKKLGVSTRAIGRWVADGRLRPTFVLPGKRYRFRWSEVEQQLRSLPPEDEG